MYLQLHHNLQQSSWQQDNLEIKDRSRLWSGGDAVSMPWLWVNCLSWAIAFPSPSVGMGWMTSESSGYGQQSLKVNIFVIICSSSMLGILTFTTIVSTMTISMVVMMRSTMMDDSNDISMHPYCIVLVVQVAIQQATSQQMQNEAIGQVKP